MFKPRNPRRLLLVAMAVAVGGAVAVSAGLAAAKLTSTSRPAADQVPLSSLSVLNRPQTPAERTSAADHPVADIVAALTTTPQGVSEDMAPGSPGAATVRIPLRHLGAHDRTLFVFQTAKGRICAGLTDFSAGCLAGLPPDVPVDVTIGPANPRKPGIVWGIARDDVRAVNVLVGGRSYTAELADNGYFFELPSASMTIDQISGLDVILAGGRLVHVPVAAPPPAQPKGGIIAPPIN